jgi:hypothetical protein
LNGFYLILPFYPAKKVAQPHIKVEQKFWDIKKIRNFTRVSKRCQTLEFSKRENIFYQIKMIILRHRKFSKKHFWRKMFLAHLDARVVHFEIRAK